MTNDKLTSWLKVDSDSDFTIRNIPFGVFSAPKSANKILRPRCCTAIGSYVLDLSILADAGLFDDLSLPSPFQVFSSDNLNGLLCQPKYVWIEIRNRLIDLLVDSESGDNRLRTNENLQSSALHNINDVTMELPVSIGDYTDFYSSREHATNVGTMFRGKDNALQPNWLHLPVGYHGRSSTVFKSGTSFHRPCGQLQKDATDPSQGSVFGPCRLLDFELEMAFFVGGPSPKPTGSRLSMTEAYDRIFGFVLMNDWSARDIQKWEYVPLGPFTAKNFATSISPWIVTTMALEEFVCPTSAKEQIDPKPLDYLQDPSYSSYNVQLEVGIQGENMSHPENVCKSNFANLYWNAAQQLVHHSVTGCIMQPGDLLASGTISGSDESSFGSMLELSWKGSREVKLGTTETGGEIRKFLKDGDTVIMKGWCEKDGYSRVGFGECSGKILPALLTKGGSDDDAIATAPQREQEKKERYTDFKLYSFWKSSSSWRVRIALAAKNIPYEIIPVDLVQHENKSSEYTERNPMSQVPVLECIDSETNETIRLSESIAIIEFLEETKMPGPSLMPIDPVDRALVREVTQHINAGTQPLQNMPLLCRIEQMSEGKIVGIEFGADAIRRGLGAVEKVLASRHNQLAGTTSSGGPFAMKTFSPTVVDLCIIPQLYNARLQGVDVETLFPTLLKVEEVCAVHPWFVPAHPSVQPDAPPKKGA